MPEHAPPDLAFEVEAGWERLPEGRVHKDVADVAVDGDDNVYALTRDTVGVIVYDRDGAFHRAFGEDVLGDRPHGITVGPDGAVYVADEYDQTVKVFTGGGDLIQVLGAAGQRSDTGYDPAGATFKERVSSIRRAAGPFNQPTAIAVSDAGDVFVADGYGNARIHRFAPDGTLLASWGAPGGGAGELRIPHGLAIDGEGRLLVADSENDRIQLFTLDGGYLEEWGDLHRPTGVACHGDGTVFVSHLPRPLGDWSWKHGKVERALAASVTVLDGATGAITGRIGRRLDGAAYMPGSLVSPHGLAVDSHGAVYVAEVTHSMYARAAAAGLDFGAGVGDDCQTLSKFTPTAADGTGAA